MNSNCAFIGDKNLVFISELLALLGFLWEGVIALFEELPD